MRISLKLLLFAISILLLLEGEEVFAQKKTDTTQDMYKLNYWVEAPATVGLFSMNIWGYDKMKDKPRLCIDKINSLNNDNVWWPDRGTLKQNSSYRQTAHDISDWIMNINLFLPGILAFDKDIRGEWLDVLTLYLEAQAINSFIYAWGVSQWSKRIRPFVYYNDIPIADKLGSGTTDSFYSGHTSTAATTSFFMAKVYCDFHPEIGGKKWLIYTAALIPPAFVGYYRYRALKHFPTDVLTGLIIGGLTGYLVPHLHKTNNYNKLAIVPFYSNYKGLALRWKIGK